MADNVDIWIGGWASDLSCWQSSLTAHKKNTQPIFIHVLQNNIYRYLDDTIKKYENTIDTIYAWSMGSLLLHQWLRDHELNKNIQLHIISPIFSFCQPHTTMSPKVLNRMIIQLKRDKEMVLKDFWNNMNQRHSLLPEQFDLWFESAKRNSLNQLVLGLEYLRDTVVLPENIKHHFAQAKFWIDKSDSISLWNPNYQLAGMRCQFHHFGHCPFFNLVELLH